MPDLVCFCTQTHLPAAAFPLRQNGLFSSTYFAGLKHHTLGPIMMHLMGILAWGILHKFITDSLETLVGFTGLN